MFGPQSVETSAHVQSTCDVLHMPHMETRWDFKFDPPSNHSINFFPHPITLGNAFRDLIKLKNWKSFAILYEENEGKCHVQNKSERWPLISRNVFYGEITTFKTINLEKHITVDQWLAVHFAIGF